MMSEWSADLARRDTEGVASRKPVSGFPTLSRQTFVVKGNMYAHSHHQAGVGSMLPAFASPLA